MHRGCLRFCEAQPGFNRLVGRVTMRAAALLLGVALAATVLQPAESQVRTKEFWRGTRRCAANEPRAAPPLFSQPAAALRCVLPQGEAVQDLPVHGQADSEREAVVRRRRAVRSGAAALLPLALQLALRAPQADLGCAPAHRCWITTARAVSRARAGPCWRTSTIRRRFRLGKRSATTASGSPVRSTRRRSSRGNPTQKPRTSRNTTRFSYINLLVLIEN